MSGASSNRHSKGTGKPAAKAEKTAWLGFVDIPLTDEQRAVVAESNFPDESALLFLQEMAEDGYKVSITEDATHHSFIASATGQHPDNLNKGYTLSGRGPDVLGSLACLAYKHITLCDRGIWSNFSDSTTKSAYG